MVEIKTNQKLEINNILSFRGKVKQKDLANIGKDMEKKVAQMGGKRTGNIITATHGMDGNAIDLEILFPIDKNIKNTGEYFFIERFIITNAVVASQHGNPARLQNTFNVLNQYITENKLQPITVGYNVTRQMDPINIDNTITDVYIGIDPAI